VYKGFKMFKKAYSKVLALMAVGTASVMAGDIVPTDFALDVAEVKVLAGVILGALGLIWVVRKVVGFLGRG
jgi:hypothetical protein